MINLAFFTHFSGGCEDTESKNSLFYFVHFFSIFAFLFILVQLVDVGKFLVFVRICVTETDPDIEKGGSLLFPKSSSCICSFA